MLYISTADKLISGDITLFLICDGVLFSVVHYRLRLDTHYQVCYGVIRQGTGGASKR